MTLVSNFLPPAALLLAFLGLGPWILGLGWGWGRPGLEFPAGVYYKHRISKIGPGRQNRSKSLFFWGPEASGGHFVGGDLMPGPGRPPLSLQPPIALAWLYR